MCTGFAVYSTDHPIYGFNFDFQESDLKFAIEQTKTGNAFVFYVKMGEFFSANAWMNSLGMFSCFNMLVEDYSEILQQSPEILPGAMFSKLLMDNASSVEDALKIISGKRYAILRKPKAHQLVADKFGEAFIIEEGRECNEFVHMTIDFIVITNFKNSDFKDVGYRDVKGFGADRYIAVYEKILKRRHGFTVEDAFKTLEKTSSWEEGFKTLASMVFDPITSEVYLVLHRRFDRIWRISLQHGTMESCSSLKKISIQIDHKSLTDKDILAIE